ncbi:MAG: zinc ABC transporter substrate-binding protein [Lentisphaeraceae bacterium]|nr:zinc ABC transporter substrate-binding protein [Lentisphaeraceae bacterium]
MFFLFSCSEKKEASTRISIAVTNFPLYSLVESISGKAVDIVYNVPEDIDPAFWEPQEADILAMQEADLILLNGATYEKWLNSTALPGSKTVNTSKDCKGNFITIKDAEEHEHNGKKHSHDGTDFNIWLDAKILSSQADEVLKQLIKLKPSMAEEFKKNHKSLISEVEAVFTEINMATANQKQFLASHPVYNYLAKVNGWELKNFHWEPDVMPSEEEWEKLKAAIPHSKYMLYEDAPSLEVSEKLKSLGVKVIVFRTGGNTPASKDLVLEMKANLENLKKALNL